MNDIRDLLEMESRLLLIAKEVREIFDCHIRVIQDRIKDVEEEIEEDRLRHEGKKA